jgi:hypothetical protein
LIPVFIDNGNLPAGIHWATWQQIEERFGMNEKRKGLLKGFRAALEALQKAGCETVYLNGSFVTSKENPNDFDGCWDVDSVSLELLDPVLMDFSKKQAAQKKKFGGELFPNLPEAGGHGFLDLFQTDKSTGHPKGIIAIDLRNFE